MNEMLTHHPRDNMWNLNYANGNEVLADIQFDSAATTLEFIDPLIDWLPYHNEKYIPTWHLVRSYK